MCKGTKALLWVCAVAVLVAGSVPLWADAVSEKRKAQNKLPAPASILEKATLDVITQKNLNGYSVPQKAKTLDEIRLAGILGRKIEADPKLFPQDQSGLVRTWLAACNA